MCFAYTVSAQFRRLVILTPENLPWNPLAVLTDQNDLTPKQGLTFKQGWTPFRDHNITSVKLSAETFNVFQITRQKVHLFSFPDFLQLTLLYLDHSFLCKNGYDR
jgi:hypothetical protein